MEDERNGRGEILRRKIFLRSLDYLLNCDSWNVRSKDEKKKKKMNNVTFFFFFISVGEDCIPLSWEFVPLRQEGDWMICFNGVRFVGQWRRGRLVVLLLPEE